MSPINSVLNVSAARAPQPAAESTGANAPGSGQASDFSATLASANDPAPRKPSTAHARDAAQGGATVPSDGNGMPPAAAQVPPPAAVQPAPTPVPTPAALAADVAAVASRPVAALAAGAVTAASRSAGQPAPGGARANGSAVNANAAARTMPDGANPLDATTAAGSTPAQDSPLAGAAPSPATQFADIAAAVAAAGAAGRLAAAAEAAPATSTKGATPGAANGGTGPNAPAAAPDAQGAPIAAAPVPVPAPQNPGTSDRHAHDGAGSQSAEAPLNAAASVTAGEAGVHGLSAAQGAQSAPSAAPPAPQLHSPQFPDQLAAHVSYLVDQNLNGATLQVSPPQLGPIELRVSIDAGHAQVWLSAHSAAACDALQQSSSKLRDMLASQGFGQVSVDVSQRSFQDRSGSAPAYVWGGAVAETAVAAAAPTVRQAAIRHAQSGALDAYA